jgi:predicted amidohydrolase
VRLWFSGIACAGVCLLAAVAHAAPVRIFAVGHKQRLADAVTYQDFRDKMAAMMDATHPSRASRVQAGVDDVASHLKPADPAAPDRALVVFPESTGLLAAFIGTRGAVARAQSTAPGAIVNLLLAYGPQHDHYAARFPGQPAIRTLVLALTDTLYRSFYETFRDLAMQYGVHLAVSADIAPARRVEESEEPALVVLLRDPDESARTYAYEAVSPFPVNTTFLFAPDGSVLVPDGNGGLLAAPAETGGVLRGWSDKAYLTPIEQPPPGEAAGLALGFGSVRDLEVIDTPVGRLASVISKDAWMVDVNDRLAAHGATVIVQPEAFDSWAFTTAEWSPDVFKEGGFANLQQRPRWLVNVNASMTGNLFDITFDGQSALIGRRQKAAIGPLGPDNAWIGQDPENAFLAIAPWIVPDPGIGDGSLSLAMRRTALVASGTALLPGSGVPCADPLAWGACENGYRDAVVFADVDLPDALGATVPDTTRATPPGFAAAVRVNPAEASPVAQSAPHVAAKGKRVFVAWHEETVATLPRVYLAVSADEGRTFSAPVAVSDNAPGSIAELHPQVALRGRRLVVVWQEFANARNDDRGRVKLARFDLRGRKVGGDVRVDDDDTAGKWLPAVAFAGPDPVVAWIDERDAGPEGEALEHVYLARGNGGGRSFGPSIRVDAGDPVDLALHLDNKWNPAIAARGRRVAVSWVDFRNYNWDVYYAQSEDGGMTFGANVRVDDFPGFERLHQHPSLGIGSRGRVHVVWTDLRARQPDTNVFHAHSDDGAAFTANARLDDAGMAPTNQWHPGLAVDRDRLFVAWQDDRDGNDDVRFTRSDDAGATFGASERVDDTGAGRSAQTRPAIAIARHGKQRACYVAWEDDRDGDPDVYVARRACGDRAP